MRVYSCRGCAPDDDYGICLLIVKDTEHAPTGCPFPTSGTETAEWELRVSE